MQRWADVLREPHMHLHRKLWEWCFLTDEIERAGLLEPGSRGLGFAVGKEPLVAFFASRGVEVLASDLDADRPEAAAWMGSGEHAASLQALNERGICPEDRFAELVSFRSIDMTELPVGELGPFDFVWSSCAFEHLGSLERGLDFVVNAMRFVRPGGLAVHTTEFNVGSDDATIADGGTVIYRRRDLEELADRLRADGHEVRLTFDLGDAPSDYHVDVPPYSHDPHLKLHLMGFTTTSYGLIIRRRADGEPDGRRPRLRLPRRLTSARGSTS
jgi:hypothetical protein